MGALREEFGKALLLFMLLYTPSETFENNLSKRRSNHCANHAKGDFVENPENCKLFYWCGENGEAVSASCPSNMLFNPESKLCDRATNVKCRQITQAPPIITSETTANEYCLNAYAQQPSSDSLIFLAHPSNCNQYYMCYYGQALLQECSPNLQWNAHIGKCDLSTNVNCKPDDGSISLPITTTSESTNINGNGIVCPSYGEHIFPYMQRCDFFIYCIKGYAILQRCPFYQYFDVETSCCKSRKTALCIKDFRLEFRKNTF